jgi:hypothetical protein
VGWKGTLNQSLARATGYEVKRVRKPKKRPRRRAEPLPPDPKDRLVVEPVFIFASIRSGSTLLRMLLGSHSQFHAPHELHLRGLKVRMSKPNARKAMREIGLDRNGLEYLLWDRVLDRELRRSGKKYIVSKTPTDVFMRHRIAECWPDARFIFLLRHPLSVARSRHAYHPQESIETNARKVLGYLNAVEAARSELPGFTVRYEEMTRDPERVTQELCAFLGVAWEPGMLDYGRRDDGVYVRGLGDWSDAIRSGQILPPRPLPSDDEIPEGLREISRAWGYRQDVAPVR